MKLTVILIGVGLLIPLAGSAQEDSESLRTVSVDEAIVFSAPDGSPVEVAAGTYAVEITATGDLRMIPVDGSDALVLRATTRSHDEDVDDALALLISAEVGSTKHLLLLTDGDLAEAVGNAGGVTTRGDLRLLTQKQIRYSRLSKLARLGQSRLPSINAEAPQEPQGAPEESQGDPVDPLAWQTRWGCVAYIGISQGVGNSAFMAGASFHIGSLLFGIWPDGIRVGSYPPHPLTSAQMAAYEPLLALLRDAAKEKYYVRFVYRGSPAYLSAISVHYDQPCP